MSLLNELGLGTYTERFKTWIQNKITNLIGGAPEGRQTLKELSDAIDNLDTSSDGRLDTLETDSVIGRGSVDNSGVLKGEYDGYSNEAISQVSVAIGAAATAGMKGWYYNHVNITNKQIFLTSKQSQVNKTYTKTVFGQTVTLYPDSDYTDSSFVSGYEVGDVISLVYDKKYEDYATITAISGNIITLDNVPFTDSEFTLGVVDLTHATTVNSPDEFSVYCIKRDLNTTTNVLTVSKYDNGGVDFGGGSLAEGIQSFAVNIGAHAEGIQTLAKGQYSHTEGFRTIANYAAHAEGRDNSALGSTAHAEGRGVYAIGGSAHAEGRGTTLIDDLTADNAEQKFDEAIANGEGYFNAAIGAASHTEGRNTLALGASSHAEGADNKAIGSTSHAEGYRTAANANNSHAEGKRTIASGNSAHAEGIDTLAEGEASHAGGNTTQALAKNATSKGNLTIAGGANSSVEGYGCVTAKSNGEIPAVTDSTSTNSGSAAHAEGVATTAIGVGSHSEGRLTQSVGNYSHVEGHLNKTIGARSHAEGWGNTAIGVGSHAEGYGTEISCGNITGDANSKTYKVNKNTEIAVGRVYRFNDVYALLTDFNEATLTLTFDKTLSTTALSNASGLVCVFGSTYNKHSHSEGEYSIAVGVGAHAEGRGGRAVGNYSHVEGRENMTNNEAEHASGKYNVSSSDTLFSVGNGTSNTDRKNAFEIKIDGTTYITVNGVAYPIEPMTDEEIESMWSNDEVKTIAGIYTQSWSDASFDLDPSGITVSITETDSGYRIQKSLFGNASGYSDIALAYDETSMTATADTSGYGFPYSDNQLGVCDADTVFTVSFEDDGSCTLTAQETVYGDGGTGYIMDYKLIKTA